MDPNEKTKSYPSILIHGSDGRKSVLKLVLLHHPVKDGTGFVTMVSLFDDASKAAGTVSSYLFFFASHLLQIKSYLQPLKNSPEFTPAYQR